MNAAKKSQQSWESLNQERFLYLLAFVFYKALIFIGLLFRSVFLASPIVRIEKEESWLFRQIKYANPQHTKNTKLF